jgi:hypothetical protein
MGGNVCGPSLIRTPDWLACALGRYHLYFAHHLGSYIRLAYADRLEGPWAIHAPGVLDIAQTPMLREHVASPDVHIDEERRELRMYFHGVASPAPWAMPDQRTCVAHSFDGITFAVRPETLGESYFRAWPHAGAWFALSLAGRLWRSPNGLTPFEEGPRPAGLPETARHLAVLRKGRRLWVAWTEIGAAPERILLGWIDLAADWTAWRLEGARDILRPERDWEGASLPLEPSEAGLVWKPAHQLRDPCFFSEDGVDYLLYAAAGESGIGLARIDGLTEGVAP